MKNELNQARFLTSAAERRGFPHDRGREVAFAGRSNAGKSSALNALTGVAGLARASKTPGRTQLVNFFELGPDRRLVDLPGYGFAHVPEEVRVGWQDMIEGYLTGRESLCAVVLVMDSRHPLTDFDRQFMEWTAHIGIPVHVLLTKADKLSKAEAGRCLQTVRQALDSEDGVSLFSATKGLGRDEMRKRLLGWLAA